MIIIIIICLLHSDIIIIIKIIISMFVAQWCHHYYYYYLFVAQWYHLWMYRASLCWWFKFHQGISYQYLVLYSRAIWYRRLFLGILLLFCMYTHVLYSIVLLYLERERCNTNIYIYLIFNAQPTLEIWSGRYIIYIYYIYMIWAIVDPGIRQIFVSCSCVFAFPVGGLCAVFVLFFELYLWSMCVYMYPGLYVSE